MKDRINSFFEYVSSHDFSATALLLACLLDEIATSENDYIFDLSISATARRLNCSVSSAIRAIKSHVKAGGLIDTGDLGKHNQKKYFVTFFSCDNSKLNDSKKDNSNCEQKLKYYFCVMCGHYSDEVIESCLCINKFENEDDILSYQKQFHKEVLIPKNMSFEDWGMNHIKEKVNVFVINN